jgi:hypothetical protein
LLKQFEIDNLKIWCNKFFAGTNISMDIFDINAEIDKNLSVQENQTILRKKVREFLNIYNQEQIKAMKKRDAELMPKEQIEIYTTELKKEKEEQAKLEFNNSLNKIAESKTTQLLEQKFFLLREYVKMVCWKNATGLIVIGETGIGKSFNILKALKESGKDFIYCSGFTTPLELYIFLFENKDKIIYLDDTKNVLKNEVSLELLKSALFSPTEKRIVRYPHSFIFNGGIILAINDLKQQQSEDLRAVLDRVLFYNSNFSYKEKIQILTDLIKLPYKELTEEKRKFVLDWIKNNTTQATINLNFRLLFKLYEVFRFNREKFDILAKHLVKIDEQKELILTLLKKNATTTQAEKEFCEVTGMSRITFYRIKAKLTS